MNFGTWATFATACLMLSIIPGPSVLVVTSRAISNGRTSAIICILGELSGGISLMILSLLGVGALVAASSTAFVVLKWSGVAYLIYLGVKELRGAFERSQDDSPLLTQTGSFGIGFWTALFNPKSLVFYLAFFAQFIDSSNPLLIQYAILILTAAMVAGLVLTSYALLAGQIREHIVTASARRKFSAASGIFYLVGGVLVAATR